MQEKKGEENKITFWQLLHCGHPRITPLGRRDLKERFCYKEMGYKASRVDIKDLQGKIEIQMLDMHDVAHHFQRDNDENDTKN
jgi:hypothetical protein